MKEWLIRAALVVLSPLLFLAAAEGVLRLLGAGFPPEFFIPDGVHERGTLTTNDRFGWRYFPRQLARAPVPTVIAKVKPSDAYRICVLGESAAMGFPEPAFGFPRMLEAMLESRMPGKRPQVINTAMTAINSHVIVAIARECAQLSPDAVVVMAGNNEVVGPFGPGTVFPGLRGWQQTTRFGQLLSRWLNPALVSSEWRGMGMFAEHRVNAGDPRLETVYRNFETNLSGIIRVSQEAGAKVVVIVPPVNLSEPPFSSPDGKANEAFQAGRLAEARDLDALRFRADSRIQAIARKLGGIDVQIGPDAFYEHVHLRPEGNYAVALAAAKALDPATAEWTTSEQLFARVALTDWDRWRMESVIVSLTGQAPFTNQLGAAERLAKRRAALAAMPRDPESARQAYREQLAQHPGDFVMELRFAEFLREAGFAAESVEQYQAVTSVLPGNKSLIASLGAAWSDAGQQSEAIHAFEAALFLDPGFDLALFGKAIALQRQGSDADAEAAYRAALAINPDSREASNNLAVLLHVRGSRLAKENRLVEAMEMFGKAAAVKPDFAEAHYDLGSMLSRQGQPDKAIPHLREAIRLKPGFADAHNNLGTALARQRDFAAAATEFEAAIRLRPDFAAARQNLERARKASPK